MQSFNLQITLFLLSWTPSGAAVIYFSADSYRGRGDNPFLSGAQDSVLYVEDFEDRDGSGQPYQLSTPNVTGWNGLQSGGPATGVQEDYSGTEMMGNVWTSSGSSPETTKPPTGIHFDFTPDAQGRLPEYVGAALRGFRLMGTEPAFNVILVYDANGAEVTNGEWLIPKPVSDPNMPVEDLFLNFEGIYVPGGISSILFRDFSEVDHLTYGYSAIPEPAVTGLAAAAALGLGLRRRRLS